MKKTLMLTKRQAAAKSKSRQNTTESQIILQNLEIKMHLMLKIM
jgi:hypothetical protein